MPDGTTIIAYGSLRGYVSPVLLFNETEHKALLFIRPNFLTSFI